MDDARSVPQTMSKALGALLRTSFEIASSQPDSAASSLPLHRAVLNAVIARSPQRAERAILVLDPRRQRAHRSGADSNERSR